MISRTLVLLIDSDRGQLEGLSGFLRSENFETVEANDGLSGLREFFNIHPDFVVVDLNVREMPVWNVITRIRELSDTPIIVTGASATQEEMARAFDLGAEGFLARPFAHKELLMRLNGLANRAPEGDEARWVYKRNGLIVDLRSCEVFVHGKLTPLTGTEYRLLTYLIERRGWVLSHDQILSHVWGTDYIGEKDQVKLYVWYLRQKIENEPKSPKMIVTKRGLGYTFVG
jgi:two-component system, OmpR family, KDP operon response regulator KdpE